MRLRPFPTADYTATRHQCYAISRLRFLRNLERQRVGFRNSRQNGPGVLPFLIQLLHDLRCQRPKVARHHDLNRLPPQVQSRRMVQHRNHDTFNPRVPSEFARGYDRKRQVGLRHRHRCVDVHAAVSPISQDGGPVLPGHSHPGEIVNPGRENDRLASVVLVNQLQTELKRDIVRASLWSSSEKRKGTSPRQYSGVPSNIPIVTSPDGAVLLCARVTVAQIVRRNTNVAGFI